ncbi:MAG: deoxyribonuclease IV [Anaerolineae bacterium]|nr:deoxyribonuclease IV [Anaerolineae bacterium]
MPRFGAHMSIAGGLDRAVLRGQSIGCETIQIFLRNSNRWNSKPRTEEELALYRETLAASEIDPVVAHAIYLINLASPDQRVRRLSRAAYREELARCHEAAILYLVLHPGSHLGEGLEEGIARIAATIARAYQEHPEYEVVTLLENTAGQGDTIGRSFEELAQIASQVEDRTRIGYCFDTAHALASGYELRTPEGYADTFARFDQVLGLDRLRCMHLNDSKADLGDERDRHAHIGEGHVGLEAFRMLVNDPCFAALPMLLETPKSADMHEDVDALALLRGLVA